MLSFVSQFQIILPQWHLQPTPLTAVHFTISLTQIPCLNPTRSRYTNNLPYNTLFIASSTSLIFCFHHLRPFLSCHPTLTRPFLLSTHLLFLVVPFLTTVSSETSTTFSFRLLSSYAARKSDHTQCRSTHKLLSFCWPTISSRYSSCSFRPANHPFLSDPKLTPTLPQSESKALYLIFVPLHR